MTSSDNLSSQPTQHPGTLAKRMIQGASIALILISLFLLNAEEPNPEWGKLWLVKPLVIVPLAGAVGGAFYYFMDGRRYRSNWAKIGANVLSVIVYIIGLWVGTVLGLNGTMWN
ncbi:hypothetical protein [Pedobacter sp.]|uniref:hypothetical protein n=1 Tax=Pedobacter sp. TaxID=1411316 RepID=UPI003D7FEFDB